MYQKEVGITNYYGFEKGGDNSRRMLEKTREIWKRWAEPREAKNINIQPPTLGIFSCLGTEPKKADTQNMQSTRR